MGMFNGVEPFDRRLHVKMGQVVSEKMFKDYMILNM